MSALIEKDTGGDIDINDAFDSIVLSENNLQKEGYDEGIIKGQKDGVIEGFHVGFHKGIDVGSEVGYYSGVVEACLALNCESSSPERTKQVLLKLRELIQQFPVSNDPNIEIINLLEKIRAKYKMACSLLKIEQYHPPSRGISF